MSKLEVKVDVVGQLKLFKSSTFTDPYSFVDEAFQNSARAKAKNVRVTVEKDRVVFEDDGIGLSDPEALFTMSLTGWDEETIQEQSPFGLGFFSCVALAGHILVESRDLALEFDLDKLFDQNDTSILELPVINPVSGFRVTLTKLAKEYSRYTLEQKVARSAERITTFKTILNGYELPTLDYIKTDDSKFAYIIDEPGLIGWIKPLKFSWDDGVNRIHIYHQDRFVRELELGNIAGVLSVDLSILDFRAPDRRDFIINEKYQKFIDRMNGHVKSMLINLVLIGTDDELRLFQDLIDRRLTTDDYKDSLRYLFIDDPSVVYKFKDMKDSELCYITPSELKEILEDEKIENEPTFYQNGEPHSILDYRFDRKDSINTGMTQSSIEGVKYYSDSTQQTKFNTKDMKELEKGNIVRLEDIIGSKIIYYTEPGDIKYQSDLILEARAIGIPVLVTKNRLETRVLSQTMNAHYIGSLDHIIQYQANLEDLKLKSVQEMRAKRLFNILSDILGLDYDVFKIGDIKATKTVTFGGIMISSERYEASIMRFEKFILVDRHLIMNSPIISKMSGKLHISELFFLLEHLDLIVEEIAPIVGEAGIKATGRKELLTFILKSLYNSEIYNWIK